MMRQFNEIKSKHPDAILLFRVGDFYETYLQDAVIASEILGITLTRRSNGAAADAAMAGFPYHALDTYLPRLVRAGKRVAICDQLEDPKLTKKLVKRGITELVTPGVVTGGEMLNRKENNFLAAVHFDKPATGLSLLDISTGEFLVAQGDTDYIDKLLQNFEPKEVLVERANRRRFVDAYGSKYLLQELEDWAFSPDAAAERLTRHFGTRTLKGFGVEDMTAGVTAAGAVLHYLDITQHTAIGHITTLSRIEADHYVRLDRFTMRNLEIIAPLSPDGQSLLGVLDRTLSPMGARMMHRWLQFPLKDIEAINRRLDAVEYFMRHPDEHDMLREQLATPGDVERILSKVYSGRINPRELVQLKTALLAMEPVKTMCDNADCAVLRDMGARINLCPVLRERIEREIEPDPPMQLNKGNVIRAGINEQLDEQRRIAFSTRDVLAALQQQLSNETGIPSLKIGYNNVFGYYIEVRNTHRDKVPTSWTRKQTLVNAERYITPELKSLEEQILGAQERIAILESQLFAELVAAVADYIPAIRQDCTVLAWLDCLAAFTAVSTQYKYYRPRLNDGLDLDIVDGRHPVIEQQLPPGEQYVPNSVHLGHDEQQIIIVTGPNMAGKSALLRQTALIVLMAQVGCFVPASRADIGVVDKIFTRVGAGDNISRGESTFMVEMTEAASILNNLSERSLVLFDELGRGTSTYDGISIAWAIVEHIHESPTRAKTLFATHYHELNEMERSFKRIANYNVQVKEIDGKVVFVRTLARGGSEHSFGIHVARLAGMPPGIVKRAEQVLKQLEQEARDNGNTEIARNLADMASGRSGYQLSLFQLDDPVLAQVRDEIVNLDVNSLTPLDALNKLNSIKGLITGKYL